MTTVSTSDSTVIEPQDQPLVLRPSPISESEWAGTLDEFTDANFYQTWAFGGVSWGDDQLDHCVLERAGTPMAIAQVRIVRAPVLRAGVAYVRWGPVCRLRGEDWNVDHFGQLLSTMVSEYSKKRGYILRVIPNIFEEDAHAEAAKNVLHNRGFQPEKAVSPYRTIRVDLSADTAAIRKHLNGKWRNQLNAAERNELSVTEGTGDDLYAQFLDLYNEMMARKQFDTSVDVEAFRRMQQRLPERQKMITMISEKDGVPQTALVGTSVGETGIYLLGATSNDGMKSKGSYLLQWRMMNRLKAQGCRWYRPRRHQPGNQPRCLPFQEWHGRTRVLSARVFRASWRYPSAQPSSASANDSGACARGACRVDSNFFPPKVNFREAAARMIYQASPMVQVHCPLVTVH